MEPLRLVTKHYEWGSREAIPRLLGAEPDGRAHAELWIGAHPSGPSLVERDGAWRGLDEVIDQDPIAELGSEVVARHGPRLPFLMKVLAAAQPLSLQTHPSSEQAAEGFAAEDERGVPIDDPTRTYKDPHHKPEILCALTPFRALCGFRAPADAAVDLRAFGLPVLDRLADRLVAGEPSTAIRSVVTALLTMSASDQAELVDGMRPALASGRVGDVLTEWLTPIAELYPSDAGVATALLLNLVELAPGEAIFLPARQLHAYLHGVGVEVMASSDNVIRGGLTSKFVDVAALLRTLEFEPSKHRVERPRSDRPGSAIHEVPVDDFRVRRIEPDRQMLDEPGTVPALVLCLDGALDVERCGDRRILRAGEAAWCRAGAPWRVGGRAVGYVADVGRRVRS